MVSLGYPTWVGASLPQFITTCPSCPSWRAGMPITIMEMVINNDTPNSTGTKSYFLFRYMLYICVQKKMRARNNSLCYWLRPCQIGILLSVNSSLINLGTYSQKHTNQKRKHKCLRQQQCIIYIFNGEQNIIIIWNIGQNYLLWLLLAWLNMV